MEAKPGPANISFCLTAPNRPAPEAPIHRNCTRKDRTPIDQNGSFLLSSLFSPLFSMPKLGMHVFRRHEDADQGLAVVRTGIRYTPTERPGSAQTSDPQRQCWTAIFPSIGSVGRVIGGINMQNCTAASSQGGPLPNTSRLWQCKLGWGTG